MIHIRNKAFPVVTVLAILACASFIPVVTAGEDPLAARNVSFCYGFNAAGAQKWADWMNTSGFAAVKFRAEDADSTDLSYADIVVIASDTGSNWSDNADLFAIISSGKPILAMGSGGAFYLDHAGAGTGGHFQIYSNIIAVTATDPGHAIYKTPNDMLYEEVYVYDSQRSGTPYKTAELPGNVTVLGNDTSDLKWALITHEESGAHKYTTWGFNTDKPEDLNAEGQMLYENVLWFSLGGYPVPDTGKPIYSLTCIIVLTTAVSILARKKRN